MKKYQVLLLTASLIYINAGIAGTCFAKDVTLQWDANTEPNIAGYRVYYQADATGFPFAGTGAGEGASPVDVQNKTGFTLTHLDDSRAYSIAVTAYDSQGLESPASNIVVSAAIPAPPSPASAPAPTPSITKGDANGDGVVDVADAVLVLRAALDKSQQTPALIAAVDIWPLNGSGAPQGDGVIDINDARIVLQKAVGTASW